MAKTYQEYIIATFIVSILSTVLTIVSISTQQWVDGNLESNLIELEDAKINYGLFGGTFTPYILSTGRPKDITIVCAFDENICAYSTASSSDTRNKELQNILNGNSCKNGEKSYEFDSYLFVFNDKINKNVYTYNNVDDNDDTTTVKTENNTKCDKTFINAGLWLTTVIFLSLAITMGVLTSTLSVVNITGNPVNPWFNIWGLYIYNCICIGCLVMVLILWASLFGANISYNVANIETITGQYSNLNIYMSYSFWINVGSIILQIINIALLYYRQYLLSKEPEINEETIESRDKDGMIFVY